MPQRPQDDKLSPAAETLTKIEPAHYALTRQITIAGNLHSHRIECTNPAYARIRLDEWERELVLLEAAATDGRAS